MIVEESSYLGEVGGSGTTLLSNTSKFTRWVPGQTKVPFPPLRQLITVCKMRTDHSIFQYESETLNHLSHHSLLTERWGARCKSVLALMLVP